MNVNETENFILNTKIKDEKPEYPFEISKIEKPENIIVSYGFLNANKIVSTSDAESIAKQEFEMTSETKKILGYNCKKAVTNADDPHGLSIVANLPCSVVTYAVNTNDADFVAKNVQIRWQASRVFEHSPFG